MDELKRTFGFLTVSPEERKRRIRALFGRIAPRYDLMNDLMSMGIHRLWKRRFVHQVAAAHGKAARVVDLAGGTGDVAFLLSKRMPGVYVIVMDVSPEMMAEGRRRRPGQAARLGWVAAAGEALPLPDDSVDAITIAFGLRNMTDPVAALAEMHRVLKPGGQLHCLEFSRPQWWLRPFYGLYSWLVIPRLGAFVARAPEAYRYLVESIRRFPDQESLARLMRAAGFSDVTWCNLSFGIAAIHRGRKLSIEAGVAQGEATA